MTVTIAKFHLIYKTREKLVKEAGRVSRFALVKTCLLHFPRNKTSERLVTIQVLSLP